MHVSRRAGTTEPRVTTTLLGGNAGVFQARLYKNLVVVVWTGAADQESTNTLIELGEGLRPRFPRGLSCVQVLAPERTKLPDAGGRAGLVRLTRDSADLMVGIALVNPGTGFVASALNSLVTGVILQGLRKQGLPIKIHSDIEAAANWLAPIHQDGTGVALSSQAILAAIKHAWDQSAPRQPG